MSIFSCVRISHITLLLCHYDSTINIVLDIIIIIIIIHRSVFSSILSSVTKHLNMIL